MTADLVLTGDIFLVGDERDLRVAEIISGIPELESFSVGCNFPRTAWRYATRDSAKDAWELEPRTFCSAATWETEGMVIEFIQGQLFSFRKRIWGKFKENTERRLKIEGQIAWPDNLNFWRPSDLANALYDVIMEEQDAAS